MIIELLILLVLIYFVILSYRINRLSKKVDETGKKINGCLCNVENVKDSLSYVRAEVISSAVDKQLSITNIATRGKCERK